MSLDLITHTNSKSPISEAYRTLRTNIQFSSVDHPIKTFVITSPMISEGKTTTLTNLAETFAQAGNRVMVVDADLRRPRVHQVFGISNQQGVTNVLAGQVELKDAVQVSGSQIHVLTSGPIPPNPSELLGSTKMKELVQLLSEHYDIVLIDAPPVNMVTDAAILSTFVDGVILAIASGKTEIEAGKRALKSLEAVNANVLGAVMTMIPVTKKGYYSYHYYSYEEGVEVKKNRKLFSLKKKLGGHK